MVKLLGQGKDARFDGIKSNHNTRLFLIFQNFFQIVQHDLLPGEQLGLEVGNRASRKCTAYWSIFDRP